MENERDPLRDAIAARIGQSMGAGGPAVAPEPVNSVMIGHWVDAFEDANPVYVDPAPAAASRHGGIVAPPAMLQTWTMARPRITGIAERGGAPTAMNDDSPIAQLAAAGYTGTLATDSELEFVRYLRPGDHLQATNALESISPRKRTRLGEGYFVTWVTTYTTVDGEVVGRQRFRILKFAPGTAS